MTTDDFEEFARVRTPHLYRTAWLLTGDRHHAEDLVQETLAKMYRAWRGIRRIDNPAAYAQTVLARTYVSQRRRRSWSEQPTEAMPDRAERPGDHELRLSLQTALAELSPLDRAVLVLRFFEDRSVEQVALDLGKNAGAIRTRTSRALDRLRTVLGDDVHLIAL
ncbi:RNA polymerase sigma-70 factor (sigma-E family) [Kribbella amoyensis]|uniref:RNA polymerase sigma-70 factor (Sigma-E family) n=1 Tax=Kribbella amoyensis TaxID=996641 RepID=A0A561BTW8_9ACTN|nr:SigE family RNA polymerase sigma factor [Kribbella amoyensis]TWD82252.1 RNA polymerase sigma-70 factor (sigma-E family) [Kribbella amoyensis]